MRSAAASSGPGRIANWPAREARHVVHAVHLLDAEALHHAVLAPSRGRRPRLPRPAGRSPRPCRRSCASRQGIWPRRAASRCARHGRRRASCPGWSSGREGWSVRPSAAHPCRRAIRSPCAAPSPCPRITPTTPVWPIPVTTSSQPNALSFSATLAAVRCTSNRISGCAWMSRRHAATSACRSAIRSSIGINAPWRPLRGTTRSGHAGTKSDPRRSVNRSHASAYIHESLDPAGRTRLSFRPTAAPSGAAPRYQHVQPRGPMKLRTIALALALAAATRAAGQRRNGALRVPGGAEIARFLFAERKLHPRHARATSTRGSPNATRTSRSSRASPKAGSRSSRRAGASICARA